MNNQKPFSVEFFAGSATFTKTAKSLGFDTFATDTISKEGIDLVIDQRHITPEWYGPLIQSQPDVAWFSPPCTAFSVAKIGYHWETTSSGERIPKTDKAREGIELVLSTLEIIGWLQPKYWYIENPRGMLRKLPMMADLPFRHTVTYCQYGFPTMKPTDIWTNNPSWVPRAMCKNGDPCHISAPRGSQKGLTAIPQADRAILPVELCREVLLASILS